jgi:LPPG:FO 2-phospho-L-lactate transferase
VVPLLIVALAGGVGAARFLEGLIRVAPERNITIIGNVGDDTEIYGLHVSPDLDIVAYTLAGLVDPERGWGFRGDTFHCQKLLQRYGYQTWFNIGDRDLATHLYRTEQLGRGKKLSEVTASIVSSFGLHVTLLPASNDSFQTYVLTKEGHMHFQEYMVKRRTKPKVSQVIFRGAVSAKPAPHVTESIAKASGVIICPSNPIVSIGAILALSGIRLALKKTRARVVGVSPIVGGKTVKGPADKLMKGLGVEPSAVGVAKYYKDFLDTLIIDRVDAKLAPRIRALGIKAVVAQTLMTTMADKIRLAQIAMREFKR